MVAIRRATAPELDRVFAALADETRRAIVARLSAVDGATPTLAELAEPFAMSRQAVAKHLDVLERAGLVHRLPDGRATRHRLTGAPLGAAAAWVERYRRHWQRQFDALERFLDATSPEE